MNDIIGYLFIVLLGTSLSFIFFVIRDYLREEQEEESRRERADYYYNKEHEEWVREWDKGWRKLCEKDVIRRKGQDDN